jgi:hypothetical protein
MAQQALSILANHHLQPAALDRSTTNHLAADVPPASAVSGISFCTASAWCMDAQWQQ